MTSSPSWTGIAPLVGLALLGLHLDPARAADLPEPAPPVVELVEDRRYLAPGIQAGANSLEVSLSAGIATVARREPVRDDIRSISGRWNAAGLRIIGLAHKGGSTALHGLIFLSLGGWGWEWWPSGVEVAVGGGGTTSRGYGLLQLSYIAGIASRFEAFAMLQLPVGEPAPQDWLSRWLFGFRYGFDLGLARRERVTRVPEREARPEGADEH